MGNNIQDAVFLSGKEISEQIKNFTLFYTHNNYVKGKFGVLNKGFFSSFFFLLFSWKHVIGLIFYFSRFLCRFLKAFQVNQPLITWASTFLFLNKKVAETRFGSFDFWATHVKPTTIATQSSFKHCYRQVWHCNLTDSKVAIQLIKKRKKAVI